MENLFYWFSIAGTAVFALSGALLALRQGMDVIGVSLIAAITGVGGGTLRDVLLGDLPPDWVQAPLPIMVCILVAVTACFCNRAIVGQRMNWLLYADAAGLALFAVLGTKAALQVDAHPLVAILFGAMSASFGGIIRDVICNETPLLLKQEIYITAAVVGAGAFVLLPDAFGEEANALIGTLLAFVVRFLAIQFDWRLNFPQARPPADLDKD